VNLIGRVGHIVEKKGGRLGGRGKLRAALKRNSSSKRGETPSHWVVGKQRLEERGELRAAG